MKPVFKLAFLAALLCAAAYPDAKAQTQVRNDPTLSMLDGKWEGIAEIDGQPFPCRKTFQWTLQDAYLECETLLWQDPGKKTLFLVEREFLRSSGEDRITTYVFSSRGQTKWGAYTGAGRQWNATLQYSDGMEETVFMDLVDANNAVIVSSLQGPDGVAIRTMKASLRKMAAQGK